MSRSVRFSKNVEKSKKQHTKYMQNSVRKYLVISFILLGIFSAKSQGNLPYYDDQYRFGLPLRFGFFVGMNTMDFGVQLNQTAEDPRYLAEVSGLMPGFTAGIAANLRLNRYFSLRFAPSINFSERALTFRPYGVSDSSQDHRENIFSVPLMLPLHLKYYAERTHNFRPYLLVGGGTFFDFGRDLERNILLRPFDYFLEIGTGCNIYFPFFRFSPELRFAIGFNNMITPTADRLAGVGGGNVLQFGPYTNSISRLTTKMITLALNFE